MTDFLYIFLYLVNAYTVFSVHSRNCPQFPSPRNGRMICDHLIGKYCTPSCDSGFVPAAHAAWAYVCNPVTKRWATYPEFYPLPWPDCVPKSEKSETASTRNIFMLWKESLPYVNTTTSSPKKVANIDTTDSITAKTPPTQNSNSDRANKRNNAPKVNSNNVDTPANETKASTEVPKAMESTTTDGNSNQNRTSSIRPAQNIERQNEKTSVSSNPQNITHEKSDLKSLLSTLFENTSKALSYQVIEHHENNRTMTNKLDLTNVTSSSDGNRNELDVENVTITTTRTKVLNVNQTRVENSTKKLVKKTVDSSNVQSRDKLEPIPFHIGLSSTKGSVIHHEPAVSQESTKEKVNVRRVTPDKKDNIQFTTTVVLERNTPIANKTAVSSSLLPPVGQTVNNDTTSSLTPTSNETSSSVDTSLLESQSSENTTAKANANRTNFTVPEETIATQNITTSFRDIVNRTDSSFSNDSNILSGNNTTESKNNPTSNNVEPGEKAQKSEKSDNERHSETTKNETSKEPKDHKPNKNSNKSNTSEKDSTPQGKKEEQRAEENNQETSDSKTSKWHKGNTKTAKTTTNKKLEKYSFAKESSGDTTDFENVTTTTRVSIGEPPLVPVFSERDLNLLRHMVAGSNSNTKRSELKRSSSSLWTKMLSLTAKHDRNLLYKPHQATRKQLAHRDPSLARLIMTHVNKHGDYKFRNTVNPFLFAQSYNGPRKSTTKEANPASRQYVWNGATYIPTTELSAPFSYLNSNEGGGLSSNSQYRWNGATFVPNENYDESRQNYDESGQVTTDADSTAGLNVPKVDDTKIYPTDITNKDVQRVLDLWNGKSDVNSESDKSVPTSAINMQSSETQTQFQTRNSETQTQFQTKNSETQTQSETKNGILNSETVEPLKPVEINGHTYVPLDSDPQNNQNVENAKKKIHTLYYWDGEGYYPLSTNKNLPSGTIKYKKKGENFEPIFAGDISNTPTSAPVESSFNSMEANRDQSSKTESTANTDKASLTYASISSNENPESLQTRWNESAFSSTGDNKSPVEDSGSEARFYARYPGQSIDEKEKTNSNVENILQSHYPSRPPSVNEIKDFSDQVVAREHPTETTPTPAPTSSNDNTKENAFFQAKVSYPSQFIDRKPENKIEVNFKDRKEENISVANKQPEMTVSFGSDKVAMHKPVYPENLNRNPGSGPLAREAAGSSLYDSKMNANKTNIIIPPPNPYLPIERNETSTNQKSVQPSRYQTTGSYQNPYLPDSQALSKVNPYQPNPFQGDQENLEAIITNDLGIKHEIESLSRMYQNSPGNTPVNIPITHQERITDLRLLAPDAFTSSNALEQELSSDLQHKSPDTTAAEKDIENADQYLQKEEDEEQYVVPTATVKSNEYNRKTEELKDILQNKNDEIMSYKAGGESMLDKPDETKYIENIGQTEKNKLEDTLQKDIEKLQTGSIGAGDESNAQYSAASLVTTASPLANNFKKLTTELIPENSNSDTFKVADIRALLQITKMAERESAAKKHGLIHPKISQIEAKKLLKKTGVRDLVKYLLRTRSKHRGPKQRKRKSGNNYKTAVHKLMALWNERYIDLVKLRNKHTSRFMQKTNPLPKFGR